MNGRTDGRAGGRAGRCVEMHGSGTRNDLWVDKWLVCVGVYQLCQLYLLPN